MEYITYLIDFILHIDVHLAQIFENYGMWVYGILFLILFCETGLVVTPFLPGDSCFLSPVHLLRCRVTILTYTLWRY